MFPPSGQLAETGTRCETGRKDSQKGIERIRDHSVPIAELGSQRKITVVAVAPTTVLNQDRFESRQRLSRAVSPASPIVANHHQSPNIVVTLVLNTRKCGGFRDHLRRFRRLPHDNIY
jgi:hypothetical protein